MEKDYLINKFELENNCIYDEQSQNDYTDFLEKEISVLFGKFYDVTTKNDIQSERIIELQETLDKMFLTLGSKSCDNEIKITNPSLFIKSWKRDEKGTG